MRYTTYKQVIDVFEVKLFAPAGTDVGIFQMNYINTRANSELAACQNMNRRDIGYMRYTGPFRP